MITYWPATAADFTFLRTLHRAGMKAHVSQIWGWDEEAQEQLLRQRFDPEAITIIRAEDRDIGVLQVTRNDDGLRLDNILLAPSHQNRGIGSAILSRLIMEAEQTNRALTLSVLRPNPARRLYERMGFVVTGEDENRFEMAYISES